jgi:hypothetical protein
MKTWYRAVCDEHKEMCDIIVSNPTCGEAYLGKHSETIQTWLEMHSNCNLRLVHRDEELEPLLGVYLDAIDPWPKKEVT